MGVNTSTHSHLKCSNSLQFSFFFCFLSVIYSFIFLFDHYFFFRFFVHFWKCIASAVHLRLRSLPHHNEINFVGFLESISNRRKWRKSKTRNLSMRMCVFRIVAFSWAREQHFLCFLYLFIRFRFWISIEFRNLSISLSLYFWAVLITSRCSHELMTARSSHHYQLQTY